MATQEKLLKSLEFLKTRTFPDNPKKKERIQHCHVVTEAISNSTIKVAPNFHSYLSITIEVLLQLCDDQESDVRMTAEECLNRIIRALNDGNIGKVQIELHKGIKRNGPARCLRAALLRFSQLAHLIRPHKGKPYVVNLFPTLVKISARPEEQIHDTLANSLLPIMKVLGSFTSENEIKGLLKAFLKNISNDSAAIRRSATTAVLNVCLNCRKPDTFFIYVTKYLLDLLIPFTDVSSDIQILGVLIGLKTFLPHIKNLPIDRLLQVYELTLYCLSNKDHNVVNASLEALNVLLQNCPTAFKDIILSPNGIDKSRLFVPPSSTLSRMRSPSQLSVSTNTTEDVTESELTDTLRVDIEKWIGESQLSIMNMNCAKRSDNLDKSLSTDSKSTLADISLSEYDASDYKLTDFSGVTKSHSNADNIETDTSSDKSSSCLDSIQDTISLQEICIGSYLDQDISLNYCTRLIAKSFLLTGQLGGCISDKSVRVSMKSLALTCLSTIIKISPKALTLYLDKNYNNIARNVLNQQITDIILYENHSDPQLRGMVRVLLANFIRAVLEESSGDYAGWKERYLSNSEEFKLDFIIHLLIKGLKDESSNCSRQALISLNNCFHELTESSCGNCVIPILNVLPSLAMNPYWLVKVSLCELVSKLSFVNIFYITGNNRFQNQIIFNVLFELIQEDDCRVRRAAATSLVQIIPFLYYEQFKLHENIITVKAIQYKNDFLLNLCDENEKSAKGKYLLDGMPFPFSGIGNKKDKKVEFSLSKIFNKLYEILLTSNSKNSIFGCFETLSFLANTYPTTVYDKAWNCNILPERCEVAIDLFNASVNFLNHSVLIYDLTCHQHVLNLTSNLFAGYALCFLKSSTDKEVAGGSWNMFNNETFSQLTDNYLSHVLKILNIFHYVLEEINPNHLLSKPVLPNLAASSPLKRRKSDLEKKMISPIKITEKDDKDKKDQAKINSISSFVNLPHYMKIYDILRSAYTNYKTSLQSEACEKLLGLLRETLNAFSVLMEIGGLTEFQGIAEEMLGFFRFTFALEASSSVECVQQLLKCLFGTNLTANINDVRRYFEPKQKQPENDANLFGFYYNIYQKPYEDVSLYFSALKNINLSNCDGDSTVMGYLHRKEMTPVIPSRSSDEILANYIRIFEPMVIKSLKLYTITSDVKLQCRVLQLLNQLIQLRVNYCLLDAEQVFIGFVLKQFEFIEEGQIPFADELIKRIFQFLVQLSHSKQHSKSIISTPKIIQLCDGLMASGQSSLTHCIPALQPIVENIFLARNKTNSLDLKELETTREVVLSMLLKLSKHYQVIDLIILILNDSKYCSNPEKWSRWSDQVFNVVVALLTHNKFELNSINAIVSLRKLIFSLEPSIFKPINHVLTSLFQEVSNEEYSAWLGKIIVFLLIISSVKEEVLITKINELKNSFAPTLILDDNFVPVTDPLNVLNGSDSFHGISPEMIFIKFLFKTHYVITNQCILQINKNEPYLVEELAIFLMYCIHIFQSGSHCKITLCAISRIKETQVNEINKNYLELSRHYPVLTFLWCYFLTVLNYKDQSFWKNITNVENSFSINQKIVSTGSVISFCNYMSEDTLEPSQVAWFLAKCSSMVVDLCEEGPVLEFISSIHRDASTSKMFLDNIAELSLQASDSVYLLKILKCVEKTHTTYTGSLLKLLLPNLLQSRELTVCRNVAKLASRKVELLLTMSMEEVNDQLDKEDLLSIIKTLMSLNLVRKYEALSSLLNKLCFQYYDISPLEFDQKRTVNAAYIKKLAINRDWYLSQIKDKCNDINLGHETTQLLAKLNEQEIRNFIECCKKTNLGKCIRFGVVKRRKIKEESILTKVIISSLLQEVKKICAQTPQPHQVYSPFGRIASAVENDFTQNLSKTFENNLFQNSISDIIPSINAFMESLPVLSEIDISGTNCEDLVWFGVICLESLNYLLERERKASTKLIDCVINCSNLIFRENFANNILSSDEHISWLCSAVNSLYKLIEYLLLDNEPLPALPKYGLSAENSAAETACHQIYILVTWLYTIKNNSVVNIPKFLLDPIKGIVVSLSRLPLVNSYALVPAKVWKTGWAPELAGKFHTQVPPLPIELLQEVDILEEFIYRVTLLGWTNRQQFEETWMCLLSVLCNNPQDEASENDVMHAASLAVRAITALLLQTLYFPVPGHRDVSKLIHISRNPIENYHKSISLNKLKHIQDLIENKHAEASYLPKLLNVFTCQNFEKRSDEYSYNQVSVKYLLIATKSLTVQDPNCHAMNIWSKREKGLETSGLDINSCLQFLLDYYTQLLKGQISSLRLFHESIRSVVIISDLFTDKTQFNWMLEIFLEIAKLHIVEDELLHQYLIVGIAKAVAVLTPDLEIYESIKRILVQYLKSSFLPTRIACLHGLLYILEGTKLSNITIGGISEEMQIILPCAVEYVQCNLNSTNSILRRSQEHTILVWSLAFFLIENVEEIHMEAHFISNTLQGAFNLFNEQKPSITLHAALVKGLEKLLIVKNRDILKRHGKQIMNLALENLKNDNPYISIIGLQLLLTYMYTDCGEHVEKCRSVNEPTNPDYLVQTIEKVSAIFEHIKRGYVFEVEILCFVLPDILNDFFSPADILTKVIGEFLSPQQPHPKLLSGVVFKVFEKAIEEQQLALLQDWVVFSLSNITQSLSLGMATWCLTCFFISASPNEWLRLFFPYVQTRVGRYEFEDRKMLCIAGTDFYNSLTNDKQKSTFIENFNKIKNQPSDTLFHDLLSCYN